MNKIININLAGRLIPIDESAYDQLRDYLNRLKSFFSREEGGDEIVRDMEDRMGELFEDKLKKGTPCIMAQDINDMISIMGSPEQIENEAGEEDAAGKQSKTGKEQPVAGEQPRQRHLARSRKDKMIGGVCGGLAAYFNIDSTIIRMALFLITLAWGAGLLVYLLLWLLLPEHDEPAQVSRRRLYRNPQQKVVGGVCSGIAAYSNIDPIIPRVIFAAPLLGIIFFSIIDNNIFFFPVLVGSLPTLVLLYIVLWAALPEATTVAEKLEMRGEKVDVHNLSQAIKGGETERTAEPRRSGLAKAFVIMVKIFVFFVLGSILLTLAGVIIAALMAILGLTASSSFLFPFSGLIIESPVQRTMLWICIILVLVIPFIAIIRLLVRMISGRKVTGSRWLTVTLTVLFIAGVFGLFWIGGSIASDFKTTYRKTYPLTLSQPSNDTLIIRQSNLYNGGEVEDGEIWDDGNDGIRFRDDSTIAISNIGLRITNSPDSLYHLSVQKCSNGKTYQRAMELATPLVFDYRQEGNILYLPRDFVLPKGAPFRAQRLRVEIQVPNGKVYMTEGLQSHYSDRTFVVSPGRFRYREADYHDWDDNEFYKMSPKGPIGNENHDEEDENQDDNGDHTDTTSSRN